MNLENLIKVSRSEFENPEMLFISGRIPPKEDKRKPYWKLVRSAQQNLKIPGYKWVNCDDIEVGGDMVHYTAAGMVTLGERQATMMTGMLDAEQSK